MSLIDKTYFVEDLDIPNTDEQAVSERINGYIQRYEPEFLKKLLGFPLYKAFVSGLNTIPPAVPNQRFIDILYGKEYTNLQGYLTEWRGLIMTANPVFNLAGGYVFKKPEYLTAGTTPGLIPGATTALFDGSLGSYADWRGWTPIIFRNGPLTPDVDYSWDPETGLLSLLAVGDKFGDMEEFFFQFELRTDTVPSTDITPKRSPIADYVYCWYSRAGATQSTGIGEAQANASNSNNQSPNQKMAQAWNDMHRWVWEFIEFMDTNTSQNPTLYPEWQWIFRWETLRAFEFSNPIF